LVIHLIFGILLVFIIVIIHRSVLCNFLRSTLHFPRSLWNYVFSYCLYSLLIFILFISLFYFNN
jgi:hypothetical protein